METCINLSNKISDLCLAKETQTHWIYFCPECLTKRGKPDRKGKLYLSKTNYLGFCFLCGSKFKLGNSVNNNFKIDEKDFGDPEPILFNYNHLDRDDLDYLIGRNKFLDSNLAESLGLRSYRSSRCSGIVIPFFFGSEIVSYQIRFYKGDFENKYYTKLGKKIPYSPTRILGKNINKREITIVEGVFDAIAAMIMDFPNPLAILGCSITQYELSLIKNLTPERIIVALDSTELSEKLASSLKTIKSVAEISLLKTNQDPEEMLNDISNAGKNSKIFAESYPDWRLQGGFKVLLLPI